MSTFRPGFTFVSKVVKAQIAAAAAAVREQNDAALATLLAAREQAVALAEQVEASDLVLASLPIGRLTRHAWGSEKLWNGVWGCTSCGHTSKIRSAGTCQS